MEPRGTLSSVEKSEHELPTYPLARSINEREGVGEEDDDQDGIVGGERYFSLVRFECQYGELPRPTHRILRNKATTISHSVSKRCLQSAEEEGVAETMASDLHETHAGFSALIFISPAQTPSLTLTINCKTPRTHFLLFPVYVEVGRFSIPGSILPVLESQPAK